MIRPAAAFMALTALSACALPPPDPEVVARECEARARAAQGPTGGVTVGVNSNDGPFMGANVGITLDAIRGRDPVAVYEACYAARLGTLPHRPPALRR
ncbi:MAG: hypothetical protein ACU0BF_04095 [Paracoccaceae bacterium]